MKAVLNCYPLGHGLTGFHSGLEFDSAGGTNSVFSQAVRKSSHHPDAIELSLRQKEQLERYDPLDAQPPSFARVYRIRLRSDFRFCIDFLRRESNHIAFFQKVRERAVSCAAILLILLSGDL